MMLNLILGFITTDATILFSVYHILRFMQYKSAQSVAPIRLPYHKIKEFYNLAPEKYEFNYYDEEGIFTYVPSNYMLYEKERIMGNSYISWLRSLRLIKQIKNNRITAKNNVHVKDYLQYVLTDAQALQVEAQKQMDYVLGEMQKPPVDCIAAYCEGNRKEE